MAALLLQTLCCCWHLTLAPVQPSFQESLPLMAVPQTVVTHYKQTNKQTNYLEADYCY
jgi:hypothetical protein